MISEQSFLLLVTQKILILPVLSSLTNVRLVANLSHLLSLSEELLCLCRISLLNREVTNLFVDEVLDLIPLWLLRVEREWVLSFLSKLWVVSPEILVTVLY